MQSYLNAAEPVLDWAQSRGRKRYQIPAKSVLIELTVVPRLLHSTELLWKIASKASSLRRMNDLA